MSEFTRTNVFLSEDEVEAVKGQMGVPYLVFNGRPPESPRQMIHRFALRHGLPDVPGYYGADLATGEILVSA